MSPMTVQEQYEEAYLRVTETEYYNRVRGIMLGYGMGEGDVELILLNIWQDGFVRGAESK